MSEVTRSGPLRDVIERRWRSRALGWTLVIHRDGLTLEHHFEGPWRQACKAAELPGRLFHCTAPHAVVSCAEPPRTAGVLRVTQNAARQYPVAVAHKLQIVAQPPHPADDVADAAPGVQSALTAHSIT